jgi:sporulation protein YlmC with PRC-barrel domain
MSVSPLSELTDWKLENSDQDLHGRRLIDSTGAELGTVEQMIVNTDAERVESVRTNTGELYPVGALEIRDDAVVFHGVKLTGQTKANVTTEDRYRIRRRS